MRLFKETYEIMIDQEMTKTTVKSNIVYSITNIY